jgi:hypothetical protein
MADKVFTPEDQQALRASLTSMKLKKSAPVSIKNITGWPTSWPRIDAATGFYPHDGGFLPYKISCRGKKP